MNFHHDKTPIRSHYSIELNPNGRDIDVFINYKMSWSDIVKKGSLQVTEDILRLIKDAFQEAEYRYLIEIDDKFKPPSVSNPSQADRKPSSPPPYNNGFSDLGGSYCC